MERSAAGNTWRAAWTAPPSARSSKPARLLPAQPQQGGGPGSGQRGDIIRQKAPSGFVYLLWVAIFTISQMLLNNIIEEKSNRIIELLLSSVTPGELMMGKLLGIAAVGLTMVSVWMASLFSI